ncbi:MAG: glycosyltransferase [Planctomycetota bacterium]|nr:glycosyltransferase [Planctomycetota bacterium]
MNAEHTEQSNRQPAFLLVATVLVISGIVIAKGALTLLKDANSVESVGSSPVFILLTIAAAFSLILIAIRWILHVVLLIVPSRAAPKSDSDLFVSAVIPAYNEEQGIEKTIRSLALQDYEKLEIVVVDDGSKDETLKIAQDVASEVNDVDGGIRVRVLTQENGGKSSALNHGIREALGEILLTVDADSELATDAVSKAVRWFADPKVDAVAGQVKVSNRNTALTRLQNLEYLIGNTVYRRAQSLFRSVLLVPGPIAMFRIASLTDMVDDDSRSSVFLDDTFAEDFEVTMAMLCKGKRIVYDPEAVAYTIAPNSLSTLVSQRYRWIRGNMQVCRKFLKAIKSEDCPGSMRTLFWMSPTFLFELTLLPLIVLFSISGLLTASFAGYRMPSLEWLVVLPMLTFCIGAISVHIQKDKLSSLIVVPLYDVLYGTLLTVVWVIAAIDELRNTKMSW